MSILRQTISVKFVGLILVLEFSRWSIDWLILKRIDMHFFVFNILRIYGIIFIFRFPVDDIFIMFSSLKFNVPAYPPYHSAKDIIIALGFMKFFSFCY